MVKISLKLLLLFLLLLLFSPVYADEKNTPCSGLMAEKDTYADSALANKNFGEDNELNLGFNPASKIIFIKFNFDNIDVSRLKENETAFLSLFLLESAGADDLIEADLLLPQSEWQEKELNWNNKPSLFNSGLTVGLSSKPGEQKINITEIVNKWLTKEVENHGLALYYNQSGFFRSFSAKENGKNTPCLIFGTSNPEKNLQPQIQTAVLAEKDASPGAVKKKAENKNEKENKPEQNFSKPSKKTIKILPLAGLWTAVTLGFLLKLVFEVL